MAANVICCEGAVEAIRNALARMEEPEFQAGLKADSQPFGDGYASERIFKVLSTFPLEAQLFRKRITY
jgi:UDP-N-acetylglucosamine 2-epimerase